MAQVQSKTIVVAQDEYLVTYREHRKFFGLFRYWEEVDAKRIGSKIQIVTDREINEVYLNGKPLINSRKQQ